MALFRRRNKAGTAQGPVVDTNPRWNFDAPLPQRDQIHLDNKHQDRLATADAEQAQRMEARRKSHGSEARF